MPTIRYAASSDISAIAEIYNEAVVNSIATMDTFPWDDIERREWYLKHDRGHPIMVAEEKGTLLGWASLSPWSRKEGYFRTVELSIFIRDGHRRMGIGKKLMDNIMEQGVHVGFHVVIARIAAGNDASMSMLRSNGFEQVGVIKEGGKKFGEYVDIIIMQRILKGKEAGGAGEKGDAA